MGDPVNILGLSGVQQHRPVIGVQFEPHNRLVGRLLEQFAELRWQIIDLNAFNLRLPAQVRFAGALLNSLPTDTIAQRLLERGVPVVRIGRLAHPDDALMPAIIPDQSAIGRLAADHFAERGFEHLGFIGYDLWHDHRPLYESFRRRAEEHRCQCHLLVLNEQELRAKVTADRNYSDIQQQHTRQWWQTLPRPLGMLAGNDMAGHRYCHWAIQAGVRVPEAIAVLGVGNMPLACEGAVVPLSSVDPDHAAVLDAAIDTLQRLVDGESLDRSTIQVPPRTVVTRRSTDVLAASDPNVVKALRYMWDRISQDLSVDAIARHVGVSRRTLELGFRRDIGRGINAEFQRRRLEKGRDLVIQTDWSVAQIADFLGFSGAKYFSKAFTAAYGTSPMKYRRGATKTP